jgi:molecular chaperone DnaK
MVSDAEKFAAEDHTRRETAEARNTADQLHYQVAKFVEENPETIPAADKDELVAKNEELKKVLDDESSDAAALTAANDAVMQVYQRVGQAMVENQQASAAAGEPTSAGSGAGAEQAEPEDDDVVEGEIVEEGGAS